MAIVKHADAREVPWRAGYRSFTLAGRDHGLKCSSSMSIVEPGSGAPLHLHENVDEVLVLIEGTIEFRLGDETVLVGPQTTISIPAGTPHSFVVIGDTPAKFFGFLPQLGAIAAATYLEGEPPRGAAQR